jgi:LmbE family N-acetylglucosaminyl deacetylase
MIFTCWPLDTHPDHRATAYMVIAAYSQVYGNGFCSKIHNPLDPLQDPNNIAPLFFWATEPWAQSLHFYPNIIINIDTTIDYKMEAIEAHTSQNRNDHLVKWVEKAAFELAAQSSQAKYCEGFMTLRQNLL